MLKLEFLGAIIGNSWWAKLKDRIRSFAADCSWRLKQNRPVVQRALESRIDRAVKVRESLETNICVGKVKLVFSYNKKYQALLVWARLRRISCEAMNMTHELWAEELREASQWRITSVTLMDRQCQTTNINLCKEIPDYFQKLFTWEPGQSSVHFDDYLADFSCLGVTEVIGCEGHKRKMKFGKHGKQSG